MQKKYPNQELMRPQIKIFDEAWALVYTHLFDKNIRKGKWQRIGNKYKKLALKARNQKDLYDIIQKMLNELGVSHLRIMDPEVFDHDIDSEVRDVNYPSIGLDIEKIRSKYYIRTIVEQSAAAKSGLKRGDHVIAINHIPIEKSKLIRPSGTGGVYRIHPRHNILLTILRGRRAYNFELTPTYWNRISASAASGKIFMKDGDVICYLHLWHLANYKMLNILRNFLKNSPDTCQGLLLDLRGFGGTIAYLDDFLSILKRWNKPIVAIIDKETRSIKETIAYHLRKQKIAILVGEKTIGSVLGSQFFDLSDGGKMIIPVMDMRYLSDGKKLEANGVKPDIAVSNHTPAAKGRDPTMEKGLEVIFAILKKGKS